MTRYLVFFSVFAILLVTVPVAKGQTASAWNPWEPTTQYVDRILTHEKQYRSSEELLKTGTDRGGKLLGAWRNGEFVLMVVTVCVSNKDFVDRFICNRGKIVAIEQFEVPFDPKRKAYIDPRARKRKRFLLSPYRVVCQDDVTVKRVRELTNEEREHIRALYKEFAKFRKMM